MPQRDGIKTTPQSRGVVAGGPMTEEPSEEWPAMTQRGGIKTLTRKTGPLKDVVAGGPMMKDGQQGKRCEQNLSKGAKAWSKQLLKGAKAGEPERRGTTEEGSGQDLNNLPQVPVEEPQGVKASAWSKQLSKGAIAWSKQIDEHPANQSRGEGQGVEILCDPSRWRAGGGKESRPSETPPFGDCYDDLHRAKPINGLTEPLQWSASSGQQDHNNTRGGNSKCHPSLPVPTTRDPSLPKQSKRLAYINVFVDDFLGLSQGRRNGRRVRRILLHAVDDVIRPLEADGGPRKEPVSLKKLR